MKYFVVTEEIPLIKFRTVEGAEDYIEHLKEFEGGIYDIQEVETAPCSHFSEDRDFGGPVH